MLYSVLDDPTRWRERAEEARSSVGTSGDQLILKRAPLSRPSGQWNEDDYDVLANGIVVGRIMKAKAAPVGSPWPWTYGFDPLERRPTHGYEATREAAMQAFARSWRRE